MKYAFFLLLVCAAQLGFGQFKVEVIETYPPDEAIFMSLTYNEDRLVQVKWKDAAYFYDVYTGQYAKAGKFDSHSDFFNGIAVARKDKAIFYINRLGQPLFKGTFDEASLFKSGLAIVKKKGKSWVINLEGKSVFDGKYERVYTATEKVAVVETDKTTYFINNSGERLNNLQIKAAELKANGSYLFKTDQGLGVMNPAGKIIGTSDYTKVDFIDPIIYFEKANTKGFLNQEGEEFLYFDGYRRAGNKPLENPFFFIYKDEIAAVVDTTGKLLTDFEFNHLMELDSDRIQVTKNSPTGRHLGLIDELGNVKVAIRWNNITKRKNNLWYHVQGKEGTGVALQYENMVSRDGEYFFPVEEKRFREVKYCNENCAVVRLPDSLSGIARKRYTLVNRQGKRATRKDFRSIGNFVDGIAPAALYAYGGEQITVQGGYLRETGEFKAVGARQCQDFHDGYAVFYGNSNPRKYGLIDADLNVIVPIEPGYESIKNFFSEDLFVVKRGTKWGYIDQHGVEVVPPQYINAEPFRNGLGLVNNCLYINRQGDTIVSEMMGVKAIEPLHDGYARFTSNNKFGYLNAKGEVHIPAQYSLATNFLGGLAIVQVNDLMGVIDTLGREVLKFEFKRLSSVGKDPDLEPLYLVQLPDDTRTIYSANAKPILEGTYQELFLLHDAVNEASGERILIVSVQNAEAEKLLRITQKLE